MNGRQMLPQRKFFIKDTRNLLQKGFSKTKTKIDFNTFMYEYKYSFPVETWKGEPTLIAVFTIAEDSKRVQVDVVTKHNMTYSPFYFDNGAVWNDYISVINNKIYKRMKKLGIYEKKK